MTKMYSDIIVLPIELLESIFEIANNNPTISKWWFEKLKVLCAKKYLLRRIKMTSKTKYDIHSITNKISGINNYTTTMCIIRDHVFFYGRVSVFKDDGKGSNTRMYVVADVRLRPYDSKNRLHQVTMSALSLGTIKSLLNSETKVMPFDTKLIKYSIMLEEINKQLSREFIWRLAYLTVSAESLGIPTQIRPSHDGGPICIGLPEEAERLLNCIKETPITDMTRTE
jgi:hypothetical protein